MIRRLIRTKATRLAAMIYTYIYIYTYIKSMELRSNLEGSKTDTNRLAERPPGTSAGRTARNSERKRERERALGCFGHVNVRLRHAAVRNVS